MPVAPGKSDRVRSALVLPPELSPLFVGERESSVFEALEGSSRL